ncbi:helix-turn-helix domain-containing protein [Rhizobium sp. 11_C7_N12_5]|uniref:helix-turn-helix domain-containing protein n=1 Tax=Rhizobium sp. 11_C7_N12_5 TaxID=3240770 RepID=UPI003F27A5EC
MNHIPNNLHEVPRSLVDVAEVFGMGVFIRFVEHFGGTEVKFRRHPGDDHPVVVALGKQDGLALCNFLSGQTVYVPHMRSRRNARRDVLLLQEQGKTRAEIARLLCISQRHVRRMANASENTSQLKLFD